MKIATSWTIDKRLQAIRSITQFVLEETSGGLEETALRAIWYITTDPDLSQRPEILEPFNLNNDKISRV